MLEEIIDLLTDDDISLVKPLLKTQVLASRINNDDLYNWVVEELKGHSKKDLLPDYRMVKCNHLAIIKQGHHVYDEQPLPLMALGKKITDSIIKFRIDNSIKSIESIVSTDPEGMMERQFGADICAIFTREVMKNGQKFQIVSARAIVHNSELVTLLAEIRTKLLDLMLKLEKEYPNLSIQLKERTINKQEVNETITYIMKQVNITTNGDGNVVNTGNKAVINNNAVITKGSKEELKNYLNEIGVERADVEELLAIVDNDVPAADNPNFGMQVNNWMQNMLGKALNGAWDISVGTAATLLGDAIATYYGLK